jgi:hypothetical protein
VASLRKPASSPDVTITSADIPETAPPTPPSPEPSLPPRDDATAALRAQIDALRHNEDFIARQNALALETAHRRKAWFENTPGAKENAGVLNVLHHAAIAAGLVDGSPEYFTALEQQLATLPRPNGNAEHLAKEMQARAAENGQQQPQARSESRVQYSAPVSREVPSAGSGTRPPGKITLTAQQKEFARISGISETEYARNLLKLNQMKALGEYNESRG